MAQREGQIARRLEALVRVLLEAARDDVPGRRRHLGRQIGRILAENRRHDLGRRRPAERRPAGEQLVQQGPEGEDVGARVHATAPDLLRCHVARRAEHRARFGLQPGRALAARVGHLGEAEVQDLHAPVARDHHVVRLQVAVGDAGGVRGGQPVGNLRRDVEGLASREARLAQRLAVHQLRDHVGDTVVRADVVERQDVRMVQRRDAACFLLEARAPLLVVGQRGGQHLHGYVAAEARVARAVDLAHAAGAERRRHLVRPRAWSRSRPCSPP